MALVGYAGRVPMKLVKPLVLGPSLTNRARDWDDLELTAALRKRLRDTAALRGPADSRPVTMVYVAADELPGAIRPQGAYTVDGTRVTVRLNLIRDRHEVAVVEVEGSTDDLPALIERLATALEARVNTL